MMKKYNFETVNIDDPELNEKLGFDKDTIIEIVTPQFDRIDGREVSSNISSEEILSLHTKSKDELLNLGLLNWNGYIWLIPGEWYSILPVGMQLHCIDESIVTVGTDYIDNDTRMGVLAYGIVPDFTRE